MKTQQTDKYIKISKLLHVSFGSCLFNHIYSLQIVLIVSELQSFEEDTEQNQKMICLDKLLCIYFVHQKVFGLVHGPHTKLLNKVKPDCPQEAQVTMLKPVFLTHNANTRIIVCCCLENSNIKTQTTMLKIQELKTSSCRQSWPNYVHYFTKTY